MSFITYILTRLLWHLQLLHVPEWDNVKNPLISRSEIVSDEEPNEESAWNKYDRFDGVNVTPDFTEWSSFDDDAVERRAFTEAWIEHYREIKPHVLVKDSTDRIAHLTGKSKSLIEKIRPAIKEMIERRYQEEYAAVGSHFVEFEYSLSPTVSQ